jgi:hypothetical protein
MSEKRGGSRINSGRKKGTGFSNKIKFYVDKMLTEMIQDNEIKKQVYNEINQLTFTTGWIYIIKDKVTNNFKIGVTQNDNPKVRLSHYVNYIEIDLIYIESINNCFEIESLIHQKYNANRIKGDWFNLSNENIISIIRNINEIKYNKIYNGRW